MLLEASWNYNRSNIVTNSINTFTKWSISKRKIRKKRKVYRIIQNVKSMNLLCTTLEGIDLKW